MAQLLLGSVLGLVATLLSQWSATGGRLKRLRLTIREELELLNLIEPNPQDTIREALRTQARAHLLEYLDDPALWEGVRRARTICFLLLWAALSFTVAFMSWLTESVPFAVPGTGQWSELLAGVLTGAALSVVARIAATGLVVGHFRRRHGAQFRQKVVRGRLRSTATTPRAAASADASDGPVDRGE